MKVAVLLLGVLVFVGPPASGGLCDTTGSGTPLANAAGHLGAGEWCELPTNGEDVQTAFYCCGTSVQACTTYADSMEWDPVHHEIRFVGQAHGSTGENGTEKHLKYTESTNRWTNTDPTPQGHDGTCPAAGGIGHGYEHNAIDPVTGDLYYRLYGTSGAIKRFNGSSWSSIDSFPWAASITGALEWFPERGELILSETPSYIAKWTAADGWSTIGTATFDNGYHNGAEYNPVHGVVWLYDGNGGRVHYRYDSSGTLTQLSSAPSDRLGLTSSLISVDPTGGEYVIFDYSEKKWYTYDIAEDQWGTIDHNMPPLRGSDQSGNETDNLEASIPEHGVMVFVSYGNNATYVYKHSGSSEPPTLPSIPQGLQVR